MIAKFLRLFKREKCLIYYKGIKTFGYYLSKNMTRKEWRHYTSKTILKYK